MATSAVTEELPAGFQLDELPAGFEIDQPKRKVGVVETTLRTVKESALKGLGLADTLATGLASIFSEDEATRVAAMGNERQELIKQTQQQPDEEFSTGGQILGGVASIPTEILGGAGVQHGTQRAKEVLERGGTMGEAQQAGLVTSATRAALNALPIKLGGKVGGAIESKVGGLVGGAATGGAVSAAGGVAARAAEDAALPEGEQFADLKQGNDMATIATDAAMGAVLGGGSGALSGRRARKQRAAEQAAAFPADKMTALGEGKFRTPDGSTITEDDWKGASDRVRKLWLEKVEEEAPPAREAKLPDETIRLREEHPSGPVADVVNKIAKEREKTVKAKADAEELRRAANSTTDMEIKKRLNAEADKLDPPEKIPKPEVKEGQPEIKAEQPKKLPAGEATELPEPYEGAKIPKPEAAEQLPTGEATEIQPIPKGEATERASGVEPTDEPRAGTVPKGEAKELYIPPEKRNAPGQVVEQESSQQKRVEGDEGGQAAKAGGGDRAQQPAPDEKEGVLKKPTPPKDEDFLFDIDDDKQFFPRIDEGFMDQQQRARVRAEPAPAPEVKERGRRQTRATIEKAVADGSIDKDAGDLALWALDKNPNLARNLRTEVKAPGAKERAKAQYETVGRVIELFKGKVKGDPTIVAHEILHHSERMMPEVMQRGIRREWRRGIDEAMKKATPAERRALRDIVESNSGAGEAFERMKKAFTDGVLDRKKFYHLTNPSEFWAVNASRILNDRYAARGSWRAQAKQWLREMIERVKGTVGLRSDADVLKALNQIMDAKETTGADRTPVTLAKAERLSKIADEERLAAVGEPEKRALLEETTGPKGLGGQRAERKLFDRFNRVAQLQKAEAPKGDDADIYQANTLYQGRAQHRGDMLEKTYVKPLGEALKTAKKVGITLRDADDYLMALHAPERNRAIAEINDKMPDGGSGLTNAAAKKIIDGFSSEQKAELTKIAKIVHDMNRAKLDAMVDDGLITADMRDTLNRKYKNYVPLKTLDEEDAFRGIGQGYSMRATDIKEALGRSSKAGSPITASLMDASRSIIRGEKARVDRSIWEYAQNKDAHDFIKPYDPDHPPKEVMGRKKGPDGKVKPVVDPNKVRDQTIDLVIDGEQQKVWVADELLRDQIRKLATDADPGPILAGIGKVTGAIGRMLTEFNPAFTLPNAVRDSITVGMRAKAHGLEPSKVVGGIPAAWKAITQYKLDKNTPDAKLYEEFLRTGGKTGAYGITDVQDTMRRLERLGANLGEGKSGNRPVRNAISSVARAMSHTNEVFEYASRFSAYKQARAKGESPRRAAAIAKDISVNFNRSGEYGRALNSVLVFANAALQGLRNTAVYAKHPSVQASMIAMAGLGPAVQAWNEIVGGMDEESNEPRINSINDAIADKSIVLMAPGSNKHIKIPLPPEYAWLYALGRRTFRGITQGNYGKEVGGSIAAMLDAVLPVRLPESTSYSASAAKSVVPSIVSPFANLFGDNKNFFGQNIVPDRHDDVSPAPYINTARRTTSDAAKAISSFLNTATGGDKVKPGKSEEVLGPLVSPEGIEHVVGYYTGGLGQFALQSTNLGRAAVKGDEIDINKIPIVNRFIGDEPKSYTSRRYQELRKDLEYAISYQKAGKPVEDEKLRRAIGPFQSTDKQLRVLFKRLKTASDAERKPIEDQIKAAQQRVIRAYNGQPLQ